MARRPLRRLNKGTRLKTFEFEGFDETNKEETQGRVRAVNDKEARRQLVYKNIRIKKIKPVRKFEKRIKGTDITIFTDESWSPFDAILECDRTRIFQSKYGSYGFGYKKRN